MSPVRLGLLAALLASCPASGQTYLGKSGAPANANFFLYGAEITRLGDLDGDALDDYAVGGPGPWGNSPGTIWIHSGGDGSVLLKIQAPQEDDASRVGWAIEPIADRDGDGLPDLLVGTPGGTGSGQVPGSFGSNRGEVRLYGSVSGLELARWVGPGTADNYGVAVAVLGDLDGDGIDDVLVGAHQNLVDGAPGFVEVLSGADGAVLFHVDGPEPEAGFGTAVAVVGDLTGDGRPEIAVTSPRGGTDEPVGDAPGRVAVLEVDGTVLWSVDGGEEDNLGFDVIVADVDGDGAPDVVVGGSSRVLALDGATGAPVLDVSGTDGFSLAGPGDLDGDGHDDVLAGLFTDGYGSDDVAVLISGADGSMRGIDAPHSVCGVASSVGVLGDVDGDGRSDFGLGVTGLFHIGGHTLTICGSATVLVYSGATHPFLTVEGTGIGGAAGVPLLLADGEPAPTQQVTLELSQAAPLSPAVLVIGSTAPQFTPFPHGGPLVPSPDVVLPWATDALGTATASDRWPALPPGTMLWAQAWVMDPTAPQNWTSTDALQITTVAP